MRMNNQEVKRNLVEHTNTPLVSVITVCMNSEKTIERTIKSVQDQTYSNIEYLVIDGYSKDRTIEIIKQYSSFISYFLSEPDNGIYDAINKGITASRGEFIAILNSDDYYLKDSIEKVMAIFLQDLDIDILYGDLVMIDENNNYNYILKGQAPEQLRYFMAIPHPTAFIRRKVYEELGGYSLEYRIASDRDFMLRAINRKYRFYYLDETITCMSIHGSSNVNVIPKCVEDLKISLRYGSNPVKALFVFLIKIGKGITRNFLEKHGGHSIVKWYKKTRFSKK